MSDRVQKVEINDADETAKEVYEDFMAVNDSPDVCSLTKVLAIWPALLKSKWVGTRALMYSDEGKLSKRLKNSIALVVASSKKCEERKQFYAHALKTLNLSDEEIRAIIRIDEDLLDEKEKVILKYAFKCSSEPLRVTDLDFEIIRDVGMSEWEIVEMQEVITRAAYYINYSNTLDLTAEPWYAGFDFKDAQPPPQKPYMENDKFGKYIDMYHNMVNKFAEKNRRHLKLNPDSARVQALLEGLARNRIEFGKAYCPCMVNRISGSEIENRKRICPCSFHKEDIEKEGACECGMFVSAN
jgi:ferredoxin-thioredoxin reductase catalytic subunit/uncharacterized protein YciW